jgi:hypothetical protein
MNKYNENVIEIENQVFLLYRLKIIQSALITPSTELTKLQKVEIGVIYIVEGHLFDEYRNIFT